MVQCGELLHMHQIRQRAGTVTRGDTADGLLIHSAALGLLSHPRSEDGL